VDLNVTDNLNEKVCFRFETPHCCAGSAMAGKTRNKNELNQTETHQAKTEF